MPSIITLKSGKIFHSTEEADLLWVRVAAAEKAGQTHILARARFGYRTIDISTIKKIKQT